MNKEKGLYVTEIIPNTTDEETTVFQRSFRYAHTKPNFIQATPSEHFSPLVKKEPQATMTIQDIREGLQNKSVRWGRIPGELLREILTKAAGEITTVTGEPLPVGLMHYDDMTKRFRFLGDKSLAGLWRYEARKDPEKKGDVVLKIFDRAGIKISLEDIQKAKTLKRNIYWERIPPETIKDVLTHAAEEVNVPVHSLTTEDLGDTNFTFLQGRNLSALINYAKKISGEKTAIDFLREIARFSMTLDDFKAKIIESRDSSERTEIPWARIDKSILREAIRHAEKEINRPFFLWTKKHFFHSFSFLDNNNLGLLYERGSQIKDEAMDITTYLSRFMDKSTTIDDVNWAMDLKVPFWHKVPSETKKEVLEKATQELSLLLRRRADISCTKDLPASGLEHKDFRENYDFLKGRSLRGLLEYGTIDAEGQNVINHLLLQSGIQPSIDDIPIIKQYKRKIQWQRFLGTPLHKILHKISIEQKRPVSLLREQDFLSSSDSLEGDNFDTLYQYGKRKAQETESRISAIGWLYNNAEIESTEEDVLTLMKRGEIIPWELVSKSTLYGLLTKMASDNPLRNESKSIFQLRKSDFTTRYTFAGDRNFGGLYAYAQNHEDRNGKDIICFLLETSLTYDDVVNIIQKGDWVDWDRLPPHIQNQLLKDKALERNIPQTMVSHEYMRNTFGVYKRSVSPSEKARNRHRKKLMETYFNELGYESTDSLQIILNEKREDDSISYFFWNKFNPWIKKTANLYTKKYFHISADELQNQTLLIISELSIANPDQSLADFISHTFDQLEAYCNAIVESRITEETLEKKLRTKKGISELTIGENFADTQTFSQETIVFSKKTNDALQKLTPLQKIIVEAISIDEATFDDVVDNIVPFKNVEVPDNFSSEVAQKLFDEALIILKGNLQDNPPNEDNI